VLTEQIDEAAASRGDAPYLEDAAGTATLTYAGLQRSARAWARLLDEAGIPSGARVAVRLPDVFGYAAALVGILAAGRVAVPLDPGAPAGDVARMLKVAQPRALVGDDLESGLPVLSPPELGPPELGPPELGLPKLGRLSSHITISARLRAMAGHAVAREGLLPGA